MRQPSWQTTFLVLACGMPPVAAAENLNPNPESTSAAAMRLTAGAVDQGLARSLVKLRIGQCRNSATDADLARLKNLPELRVLHLCSCADITDAGLEHLKPLEHLEELFLNCAGQVSDRGLQHLAELPRLRTVYLRYCRKVTPAGLQALQARLPGCRIVIDRFPWQPAQ